MFIQPTDVNTKIWRYMDLAKFISLLEYEALFFTRLDFLADPFEGFNGLRNKTNSWTPTDLDSIKTYNQTKEFLEVTFREFRQRTMVSCWYMSEYESAAMWTQYGRTTDALCIQTTYSKLRSCLPQNVHLGSVQYGHDYPSDLRQAAMYKSKEYEQEKEVRALIFNASAEIPSGGVEVKVDLDGLVEKIIIAPNSNPWFGPLIKKVATTYGLSNKPVVPSALDEKPYF